MSDQRTQRLADFVDWYRQYIKGDEKSEAQLFLDRFFQAFGHPGLLEAGGEAEFRIRKSKEDGGGTAFADCVWKPHVLIEMKKRGADLAQHYRQAFDYWTRLVPGRPRYVVLCNFDELWVFDFETQLDVPVDRVALSELPERYGPLAFLFPTHELPVFGNDHEKVTREAAARLATCFRKLAAREDVGRERAQRFILQMLVALFAEDIGLLEQYTIERLIADCQKPADGYDLIGGLFLEMNNPGQTPGGRFKGVDYFNGGIFADPVRIELHPDELALLRESAKDDWSKVRPEIFGTLFEQTCDQDERHAYGGHFTSAADIMKIVKPTITEPWERLIEQASTVKRLRQLHQHMQTIRILDPACGSGNFLYLAYRELKRLEKRLTDKLAEVSKRHKGGQQQLSFVTTRQFFGMDINPFAVELAKVTMMLAHKLAIDEVHSDEAALPLDNLDDNIVACDALVTPDSSPYATPALYDPARHNAHVPTAWPEADVIIGNPPFLGAKRLQPERGEEYVETVRTLYPDVPGMADYCVYWFRRAHDHLPSCTPEEPFRGRAGLVGTQNIRNNKSREGGLDYVTNTGTIVEAVDNQPWSGDANVHVSIVNWVKGNGSNKSKLLLPNKKKLWFKVEEDKKDRRKRGQGSAAKDYELTYRLANHINAALSDVADVGQAKVLKSNTDPQCCFQGVVPGYDGFGVSHHQRSELTKSDRKNAEVVRPWLIGRDLLTGDGTPSRSIVDFGNLNQIEARSFEKPFKIVEREVLPAVKKKAEESEGKSMAAARNEHLERWWQFWNVRAELRSALSNITRYIACSRVTKRPIFCFVSSDIVPDGALQVWAFEDDYSFGVIQSQARWTWFFAKCSKLTERYRYTRRSVWDTFPWPQGDNYQGPTEDQVESVATAARNVRQARVDVLKKTKGGLRALYRTLEQPGKHPLKEAHAALDKAVLKAYGFSSNDELLAQLLDLNATVAERIQDEESVVAPGPPPQHSSPKDLISDDCVTV